MWLFGDSFDHYTDLTTKYDSIGVVGQGIGVGEGRYGTNSLRFTSNAGRVGKGVLPGSSTAGAFASFAFRTRPTFDSNFAFANLRYGPMGRGHVLFVRNSDGSIAAWSQNNDEMPLQLIVGGVYGAFIGATPPGLVSSDVYTHVELFVKVHPTAGIIKVRVNGGEVLSLTDRATQNSRMGSAAWSEWVFGMDPSMLGVIDIDDLMLYDDFTSGDGVTAFLGDLTAECVLVTGSGTSAQWTRNSGATNAGCVGETPPDGDSTYVEDGSVGHVDTYAHAALTRIVSGIRCVQVVTTAKKTDAGTRAIAAVVRRSAVDYAGADRYLSTVYTVGVDARMLDPATGLAWTAANVNDAQIGQKVSA